MMRNGEMTWLALQTLNFVCQNCGAVANRWQGKCDGCGEWNTLVEEGVAAPAPRRRPRAPARAACSSWSRSPATPQEAPRLPSGVAEFDRVTGGGLVRGSVLLMAAIPASASRPC